MAVEQWIIGAIAIAAMFMILIAPHEAGHFGFAKLFRVRVIEFSIGMGYRLWSATAGRTLYAARALPIGGYVRMGGMEPGDYDEPDGFHAKPAYQRLLILFGGPLANFIIAALLATAVYLSALSPAPIAVVTPGTPAAAAGLRAGDAIEQVNGQAVDGPDTLQAIEVAHPGAPLDLVVKHPDGSLLKVKVTPEYSAAVKRYVIGIQGRGALATLGGEAITSPGVAVKGGLLFPFQALDVIGQGLYQMATGQIPGGVFGPQGATGAIGIGAITYHAANQGLVDWLYVAALLSVALGSANLLPLPALDGGRMVTVLIEKLRGRPFNRDREMQFQRAGLVALLALMAVIAYFDITRLASGQFPGLR